MSPLAAPLAQLIAVADSAARAGMVPAAWREHLVGIAVGGAFVVGAAAGAVVSRLIAQMGSQDGKPRYPRDWPKARDLFTSDPDPTKPGYLTMSSKEALGSGHTPLGRTYPRMRLIPDIFPLREWRRRVEWWTSKAVWIPYMKRFQHLSVLGATGKGKSTAFVVPQLVYGALERQTAYYVIDVKSPQFLRYFGPVYRANGKEVVFFDPFMPEETLAFEPLWKSADEVRDELAEVISTYTTATGSVSESGNSEFFKDASKRTTRSLLDLATFWPRNYCSFPVIQQLIGAGGATIAEAIQALLAPGSAVEVPRWDETIKGYIQRILDASAAELRPPAGVSRDRAIAEALSWFNRSGYQVAFRVRRMREYVRAHRAGQVSDAKLREVSDVFWLEVEQAVTDRRVAAEKLVAGMNEFIQMADETKSSVISGVANKTNWFKESHIARAFSRDELDIGIVANRPCLFLVGAPMARLQMGSLFVCSILTNMMLNSVFERGMRMERGDPGVSKHGVMFMLDEFVQLNIKKAPQILATFRGFRSGLTMITQERGQLKQLYSEDATTMEGNTVHKVLLQGSHEDSAEYYADKAIGRVTIVKRQKSRSGKGSEGDSVSESREEVPLMTGPDVKQMRLNGRMMPKMALSIGADVSAFPIRPVQFWEDPMIRKLMRMKKRIEKTDKNGRPTWRFWEWKEMWSVPEDSAPYLVRRRPLSSAERAAGLPDPVTDRRNDPYTDILDFLLGAPAERDELYVPPLRYRAIGVYQANPLKTSELPSDDERFGSFLRAPGGMSSGVGPGAGGVTGPFAGSFGSGSSGYPTGAFGAEANWGGGRGGDDELPLSVAPYSHDFRTLLGDDFAVRDVLPALSVPTGRLDARVDHVDGAEDALEDEA